ncbi:angiotensinogen [Anomaloglossus baeobatrachus]|uniref:angiotensinogen n=1 Tax=Anomaloglossus baeobatrachus TaxID=238106 RepID=UPI003F4FA411
MHLQHIMLCLTAFLGLSTCNRVYVHPFNLLAYSKSECDKIESQDHSVEKTFSPIAIETKNNEEKKIQMKVEAVDFGPAERYLVPMVGVLSFRAVAGWWKLHKSENILIPNTDFFRTIMSFYLGASGNTSRSLQTFLGLDDPSGFTNCTSKVNGIKVLSKLKNIDQSFCSKDSEITAHRRTACIFVSPNVQLSEKFVQGLTHTADNLYIRAVDFKDSAKAVKSINEFLDSKLPPNTKNGLSSIDGTINFLYSSHIHFKGKVANSSLIPNHQPFWIGPSNEVLVPMISVTGMFPFTEDITTNQLLIKIPLCDNDFLLLAQPINGNTLENIESSMKWETYLNWIENLYKIQKRYINLSLPKVKIELSYNVQDLLSSINVLDLLGKNADFSKMSKTDIKVGKVINIVDFELEESDIDSNGESNATESKEKPVEVKLNKPFILALCEGTSKSLLLLGRVVHPTNSI